MGTQQEFIAYKNAIEAAIKEQFPAIDGKDIYLKVFAKFKPEELVKPAIIFGIPIKEKSPISNDEEFYVRLNNSVFIITSPAADNDGTFVQQLSANLSNFIEGNQWGINAAPAEFIADVPDIEILDPNSNNVQRIDFTQDLLIIDKN